MASPALSRRDAGTSLVSETSLELTPSEIEYLSFPITSKYTMNKVIGSPFNRARFVAMPPLSIGEMSSILSKYEKLWVRSVPDKLKYFIMSESGHIALLMSLVYVYDSYVYFQGLKFDLDSRLF